MEPGRGGVRTPRPGLRMGGLTVLPCPRLPRPPHAVGPDRRQIVLKSGNLLLNWATNYAIVSGTGLSGLSFRSLVSDGAFVGVDLSPDMLEKAKERD